MAIPHQVWIDASAKELPGEPDCESLVQVAVGQYGFEQPRSFYIDIRDLDLSGEDRRALIDRESREYVDLLEKELRRPRAVVGYGFLQPALDDFSKEHPDFDKNVFIAMRFKRTQQFQEIDISLRQELQRFGLCAHRADDKMYAPDGDLWHNVCIYMMGCRYAVCVFEEIDEREFNPNITIEFGFLRAQNRTVLLLKEQRMPTMPTDIAGKVYRTFDSYKISTTVGDQVRIWAERDLGLQANSPAIE